MEETARLFMEGLKTEEYAHYIVIAKQREINGFCIFAKDSIPVSLILILVVFLRDSPHYVL